MTPMLSILIPTLNYDVSDLCMCLHKQCLQLKIQFEIIVADDGSDDDFKTRHEPLETYENIRVLYLQENIGRAAIRNYLASNAAYSNLLFLDADSEPYSDDFIKCYIDNLGKANLICGGRKYLECKPEDQKYWLHWTYGHKRESKSAEIRNVKSYEGFQTNNFLIEKNAFNKVRFDEDLKTYGHEDTLFGHLCKKAEVSIYHIDNPVYHIGLDDQDAFLDKTIMAVKNLRFIEQQYPDFSTRLSKQAHRIPRVLRPLLVVTIKILYPILVQNIKGENPLIRCLDFIKLYHYYK